MMKIGLGIFLFLVAGSLSHLKAAPFCVEGGLEPGFEVTKPVGLGFNQAIGLGYGGTALCFSLRYQRIFRFNHFEGFHLCGAKAMSGTKGRFFSLSVGAVNGRTQGIYIRPSTGIARHFSRSLKLLAGPSLTFLFGPTLSAQLGLALTLLWSP